MNRLAAACLGNLFVAACLLNRFWALGLTVLICLQAFGESGLYGFFWIFCFCFKDLEK
jgi:hypothetical protein